MAFKLGVAVDLRMAYVLMLVSTPLIVMQGHSGSTNAKKSALNYLHKQASNKQQLATTAGQHLRDLDFKNVYMAGSSS